ncbi:hypothetical protein F941_01516 [Acinetobacter bouvetii DSM 14964 = CIP 107468]|uniref:Uncharacterized protein n=1 Tax=Acinetobacter bouvetii DSM 14964 = CIP 107468 TaxID=1120925 RepID=N9DPX6_9GAMM|nr:hypothetical protein [Acinetobacter bouvetii]ENV82750.1 hypothetical protein F941_01516 [Acinetobacter bouvetii DSM 14964 = CIP 107468]BCU64867.1 hypothetical protein ACBO_16580 [Acinetobacter bouvetii]
MDAKAIQYARIAQPKLSALAQALQDAQRQPVSIESLMKEQQQATTAMNQVLETVEDIVAQAAKPADSKTKPKFPAI